jgi:hypothetical protein
MKRTMVGAGVLIGLGGALNAAVREGMDPDSAFLIHVPHPSALMRLADTDHRQAGEARRTDGAGLENLALRPEAHAFASGCLKGHAAHRIGHLNDGRLGNAYSWVADAATGWAEIDLGGVFTVCRLALGSDSTGQYRDRAPTAFEIQSASDPGADAVWKTIYAYAGEPIHSRTEFTFPPVRARRFRVVVQADTGGEPRLEEVEVFGSAEAIPDAQVGAFSQDARTNGGSSDYASLLQLAILGEEHAWLKTYGYGDVAYRLRRTPYPEKREPRHQADDLLPLPMLTSEPQLSGRTDDAAWDGASRGVARVCHIATWPTETARRTGGRGPAVFESPTCISPSPRTAFSRPTSPWSAS